MQYDKEVDGPPISFFFLMSDLWRTLYRTFCYRKKIKGHVLLVGTDRYNVRDNWLILILFSHDHIGLSFYKLYLISDGYLLQRLIAHDKFSVLLLLGTHQSFWHWWHKDLLLRPSTPSSEGTIRLVCSLRDSSTFPLFSRGKLKSIS